MTYYVLLEFALEFEIFSKNYYPLNKEFQKQQEHWNAVEKARLEAEAENIKQYAKEQEKRAIERQIKRKEANAALAQVQENLAAELAENQRQKVFFSKNIKTCLKSKIGRIRTHHSRRRPGRARRARTSQRSGKI